MFYKKNKEIVWGMKKREVKGMLEFEFVCRR
jgi:hypothetical protein